MNISSQFKSDLITFSRSIFSYLVPKKKGLLVFRPTHDKKKYSGNVKSLQLYINEHHPEFQTVLASGSNQMTKEAQGFKVKTASSLWGISWHYLRAQHIVIDSSGEEFKRGRYSIVQLWHGSGVKNTGYLDPNYFDSDNIKENKLFRRYKLFIATSPSDRQKRLDSFRVENVQVTGYPRNDVFFEDEEYFLKLKKKYGLDKFSKIITYAPTFREFKTKEPFSAEYWEKFNDYLKEIQGFMAVKKHPWDNTLNVPDHLTNIKDLSHQVKDIQELLLFTDVLIADYSSLITDFGITRKPILVYAYDLEEFMETCRSMYYNLEEVMPQPFIKNQEQLLNAIMNLEQWQAQDEVKESYQVFLDTFHTYLDGNSCQRVVSEIHKLK